MVDFTAEQQAALDRASGIAPAFSAEQQAAIDRARGQPAVTAQDEPGFIGRISSDIGERVEASGESIARGQAGGQTILETGFQIFGDIIGGGLDVAGEAIGTVGGAAVDAFTALAPDTSAAVSQQFGELMSSDVAQAGLRAIAQGAEAFDAWAKENPRAADNFGALGNILSIIPAGKVASGAGQAGRSLSRIPEPRPETIGADFAAAGVQPTLGMSGGRTGAVIEGALEVSPVSAGRIAAERSRVTGEISDAAKNIAADIGVASNNVDAGQAIQEGLQQFVSETDTKAGQLFERVDNFIPPTTKIAAPETAAAIRQTLVGLENTPEIAKSIGASRWARIADELEGGELTWKAARAFRSDMGEAIGKISGPFANMDQGRLKLAYGKLSDDLANAAAIAGPEAEKAWSRASKFYAARQKRVKDSLKRVLDADEPEKAFSIIQGLTQADSARGSVRKLAALKRSLPREDWNDLSATFFSKMGQAPAGGQDAAGTVFSPGTFLTNWNKMSPEARRLMTPNAETASALNSLAKTIEKLKTAGQERNFSKTGQTLATLAFGGLGFADLPTAGALAVANFLTAQALTSKTFVNALNRGILGNLNGLRRIATGKSAQAAAATALLREIGIETVETVRDRQTPTPR